MPNNPDVLQVPLGTLVTLVLVRDKENDEIKVVIQHRGVETVRREVAVGREHHKKIGNFFLAPMRRIVTDDPRYEPESDTLNGPDLEQRDDEEITKPGKVG